MFKHKLTVKEAAIITSLLLIIVAYLYYAIFWTNYQRKLNDYNDIDLQSQIEVEQIKANSLANMRSQIESSNSDQLGEIAVYNNQSEEIRILNDILVDDANSISVIWKEPVLDGSIVRRQAELAFTVESYETAVNIISSINDCGIRVIINNLAIEGEEGVIEVIDYETEEISYVNTPISVSLTVTFFETIVGADNTSGLEVLTTTAPLEDAVVDYDMFD